MRLRRVALLVNVCSAFGAKGQAAGEDDDHVGVRERVRADEPVRCAASRDCDGDYEDDEGYERDGDASALAAGRL